MRAWSFASYEDTFLYCRVQKGIGGGKPGCNTKNQGQLINSDEFNDLNFDQAFDAIAKKLEASNLGSVTTNFRLRDWGVSRQRYWGTPIPMFNLSDGADIPVPLEKLPVLLPEDVEMDGIQSPIKADPEWRKAQLEGQAVEH